MGQDAFRAALSGCRESPNKTGDSLMASERETYYRFVVTAIGELVRCTDPEENKDRWLGGGVNIGSLAAEVLTPEDYDVFAQFDRENAKWRAVNRYVQQCVDHQFYVDAYEDLSLAEFDFYCDICELQRVNCGRFRIWGEMHADNLDAAGHFAWLVTEFRWWVDDKEYWPQLDDLAGKCSCEAHLLHEGPHVDQCWPAELVKTGVDLTDENAVFGENHGRPERQVEFRCNVYGCTEQSVRRRITELADWTEELWRKSGVSVC
jgi:hypothetical protein